MTDIFVHDRQSKSTSRVSVDSIGTQGSSDSLNPTISSDGSLVAFDSTANNLVLGDTNAARDVFVHELQVQTTMRVSMSPTGTQYNSTSFVPVFSADGRVLCFQSDAMNVVAGDTNGATDIFVVDLNR